MRQNENDPSAIPDWICWCMDGCGILSTDLFKCEAMEMAFSHQRRLGHQTYFERESVLNIIELNGNGNPTRP